MLLKSCSVGMRVLLLDPKHKYLPDNFNPRIHTEYECTGTIKVVYYKLNRVQVLWDNATLNTYNSRDLIMARDDNGSGFCQDLWNDV